VVKALFSHANIQTTAKFIILVGFSAKYPYLLTSWSGDLLEKPPLAQPLENFPAFYGTGRFIAAFIAVLH
jgi:hypothetical protein